MERLTKRSNKTVHENGVCCTHFMGFECSERMGECTDNCPWEEAAWSKLADYEDIGTVSDFRELKEKKYDCDIKHLFGECSYAETGCSDCIGKLKIKDALGKATAKKPLPFPLYGGTCPNCNNVLPYKPVKYCFNCGTALDWSEGKE